MKVKYSDMSMSVMNDQLNSEISSGPLVHFDVDSDF
jgi:hypothetical protein